MDDPGSHPRRSATSGRAVFLVEAYRSATSDEPGPVMADDRTVIGIIDIPSDETVLYLVAATDATRAERTVRARGITPIRVVDVRWDEAD